MLRKIEEIRKKPKQIRDRYAVSGALLVTALVAVIWIASLPARFSDAPQSLVESKNDERGGFSRAFSDIQGQFAGAIDTIGGAFAETEQDPENAESDQEPEPNTQTSESKADSNYQLDFEAMLNTATNSTTTKKQEEEKKPHRQAIIATSSASVESN